MNLLISHLELRRIVGSIGLSLPLTLWFAAGFGELQPSLSAYYRTEARDAFVSALCVIGAFLFAYHGYDRRDRAAGIVAGLAITLVALVPFDGRWALLHAISAAVFFLAAAYFSLVLFVLHGEQITRAKLRRNRVYRVCGWTIIAALIGAVAGFSLYWCEVAGLVSFGVAWAVKGEAILKDQVAA